MGLVLNQKRRKPGNTSRNNSIQSISSAGTKQEQKQASNDANCPKIHHNSPTRKEIMQLILTQNIVQQRVQSGTSTERLRPVS